MSALAPLRHQRLLADSILVSDHYLDGSRGTAFWFQVDAERDPPSSFPIAGCDVEISIEVRRRITFTQRKFRGFQVDQPDERHFA